MSTNQTFVEDQVDFAKLPIENIFDLFRLSTLLWEEASELNLKLTFFKNYQKHLLTSRLSSHLLAEITQQLEAGEQVKEEGERAQILQDIMTKIVDFMNQNKSFFIDTGNELVEKGMLKK